MEIGRVCIKIAGRDAGTKCIIVDTIDKNHVLVDGESRRKKVNLNHLEFTPHVVKIKKGASNAEVARALNIEPKQEKKAEKKEKKKETKEAPVEKSEKIVEKVKKVIKKTKK